MAGGSDEEQTSSNQLAAAKVKVVPNVSQELRSYYEKHGVDVDRLVMDGVDGGEDDTTTGLFSTWRFIRLNPRFCREETLLRLKKELADSHLGKSLEPQPVSWMEEGLGFFSLPGDFRLAQSPCYREGRVYGMDISSGAAVAALLSDRYDVVKQNAPIHTIKSSSGDNADTATSQNLDCSPISVEQEQSCRVLDMCCAPGLKLCAITDYLSTANPLHSQNINPRETIVVGVDVSETRLAICKRILQKYHVHPETSGNNSRNDDDPLVNNPRTRIRLYCCDGTTFDQPHKHNDQERTLVFDSDTAWEEQAITGKRKRMNKSARAREQKRLKTLVAVDFDDAEEIDHDDVSRPEMSATTCDDDVAPLVSHDSTWKRAKSFDKVIVDAECSTDGSLKHIQKQIKNTNKQSTNSNTDVPKNEVATKLMDSDKLSNLVQLQKDLAATGFRLLKPGGTMVYSTCSLSEDQNEKVVAWLLNQEAEAAFVIPISFSKFIPLQSNNTSSNISEGKLGVRFHPYLPPKATNKDGETNSSNSQLCFGGGFFLAKIGKRADHSKG